MRRPNHASRFEGLAKTKLQASRASDAETLQSQVNKAGKKRLSLSGLELLHARLAKWKTGEPGPAGPPGPPGPKRLGPQASLCRRAACNDGEVLVPFPVWKILPDVVCASSGLFTQFDTVTSGFRNYRGLWPACAGRQGMLPGHTANLLEGLRSAAAPSGAGPRRSKQAARLVQQQLRRAPQSFASR